MTVGITNLNSLLGGTILTSFRSDNAGVRVFAMRGQRRQLISEPQIWDLSPGVASGITDPNSFLLGTILGGFGVWGRIIFTPLVRRPQN